MEFFFIFLFFLMGNGVYNLGNNDKFRNNFGLFFFNSPFNLGHPENVG